MTKTYITIKDFINNLSLDDKSYIQNNISQYHGLRGFIDFDNITNIKSKKTSICIEGKHSISEIEALSIDLKLHITVRNYQVIIRKHLKEVKKALDKNKSI